MNMLNKFKKNLRLSQTDPENMLWYYLKNRNMKGVKFRRQHVLEGYIVDFVCLEVKLIVELDGSQHVDQKQYDVVRTKQLSKDGFVVMRFWNNEIREDINTVLEAICDCLEKRSAIYSSHS